MRRFFVVLILAIAAVVVAAIAVYIGRGSAGRETRTSFVPPTLPDGIVLRQSAHVLERRVLQDLGRQAQILEVRVVPRLRDVPRFVPQFGSVATRDDRGAAWIIWARGVFRPVTTPPGATVSARVRKGYIVFDDASGVTLGFGW